MPFVIFTHSLFERVDDPLDIGLNILDLSKTG